MASQTQLFWFIFTPLLGISAEFSESPAFKTCSKNNFFLKYFPDRFADIRLDLEQLYGSRQQLILTSHYYSETGLPKSLEKQLNEQQIIALNQLADAVRDVNQSRYDNICLLWILLIHQYDVSKSERTIRKYLKVIRNVEATDILNSDYNVPELIMKYKNYWKLWGIDENGSLIISLTLGGIDGRGLVRSLTYIEIVKPLAYLVESLIEITREIAIMTGKINLPIFIVDYKDVDYSQVWDYRAIVKVQRLLSFGKEFPNGVKTVYHINMPVYVVAFSTLVKPFTTDENWEKSKLFSSDGWQEEILRNMNRKLVPIYFGGDLNITHQRFNTSSSELDRISEEYYIDYDLYLKETDPGVATFIVPARDTVDYQVNVQKIGTVIKWVFQTMDYSIHFGVFFRAFEDIKKESAYEEILQLESVDSHVIPEREELQCDSIGQYILRFDNTQSWFLQNDLLLKVDVIDPV